LGKLFSKEGKSDLKKFTLPSTCAKGNCNQTFITEDIMELPFYIFLKLYDFLQTGCFSDWPTIDEYSIRAGLVRFYTQTGH
jgi:hypothetical protein